LSIKKCQFDQRIKDGPALEKMNNFVAAKMEFLILSMLVVRVIKIDVRAAWKVMC